MLICPLIEAERITKPTFIEENSGEFILQNERTGNSPSVSTAAKTESQIFSECLGGQNGNFTFTDWE